MKPAIVAAYVAAYIFLDWISYVHPVPPLGITPWNPPPGLSLFLLLLGGLRYWPALFVAALSADVLVRGAPVQWPALLASAAIITGVYAGAAYVLLKRVRVRIELETVRDLGVLLAVIIPATLTVAMLFVGLFTYLGVVPRADLAQNTVRYWIGDLNGILVLAPVLLVHARPVTWGPFARRKSVEAVLQLIALVASLWLVFVLAGRYEFVFFSLLFLPLVWIAARWGLRGATLALAALQLGLIGVAQTDAYLETTFVQLQFVMLALSVTGLVLGIVVTQRRQVEASLREKQATLDRALRFAAAGEMSSAMAHELNQPIAALTNYLGACQMLARAPDASRALLGETLDKSIVEAQRAGEIVHRIREFYTHGTTRPESVSALRIVEGAAEAVRPRAEAGGIRISIQASPGLRPILADPLQVETAVHNVLNNSVDALADRHGEPRVIEIGVFGARGTVEISIRDNGTGIAADIQPHLFEPFHTSKPDGMGLGLAISRSLVRANHGEMSIRSRPEGGVAVTLVLPADPAVSREGA